MSARNEENLFSKCSVFLFGNFPAPGPPRSDIEYLLSQGGAEVTSKLETFLQWVDAYSTPTATEANAEVTTVGGSSSNKKTKKRHRYLVLLDTVAH